jgi:hypothetical protein
LIRMSSAPFLVANFLKSIIYPTTIFLALGSMLSV